MVVALGVWVSSPFGRAAAEHYVHAGVGPLGVGSWNDRVWLAMALTLAIASWNRWRRRG